MKIRKSLLLVTVTLTMLSGCSSVSKITSASPDVAPTTLSEANKNTSEDVLKTWSHKDLGTKFPSMNLDGAYELLKNIKSKNKVIVGVVDSGIDINHEDLKNVIWTNPNEIPGNGIDDDNNGYVDDIHGWNFLGGIVHENLEFVRIYKTKDKKNPDYLKAEKKYRTEYDESLEIKEYIERLRQMVWSADEALQKVLKKNKYTASDLSSAKTTDSTIAQYIAFMREMFSRSEGNDSEWVKGELDETVKHYNSKLNYHLNLTFNPRQDILKDNENDFTTIGYGDNNVIGPVLEESLHGTHVAGIIAAERNNNLGMNGVASNVAIMALRAVPNGDEYDKDIALAIRYAVDNGAKVINASFGKGFSPHKSQVHDAIKYAASKDVLIVNAAGNESIDVDTEESFPNDNDEVNQKEISDNFLTVGALNYSFDENLVAPFSNYGKRNVDVFAPGVMIWAPAPDSTYKFLEGTSMASPGVAGIAALIRSYFPNLTAAQVKQILIQSAVRLNLQVWVGKEENRKKIDFSELSTSGAIVNARNAIILAAQMSKKKK